MNQKQYDDMTTIMQCGRSFAKAMRTAMLNCGLLQAGFNLTVSVEDIICTDGTHLTGSIRLQRLYDDEEKNDHSEDMSQLEYNGERWAVVNDPYAKAGTLPPQICSGKANDSKRVAETGRHEDPVDGLWISSHDDPPVLDGGQ